MRVSSSPTRRTLTILAGFGLLGAAVPLATVTSADAGPDPAVAGSISGLIQQADTRPQCFTAQYDPKGYRCPPAAMAVAVLPNGKVLFWDGLEGMNRVQLNVVAEFGDVAQDDQSRLADFTGFGSAGGTLTPQTPGNETASPTGGHSDPANSLLPGGAGVADSPGNDYDLFCSSLVQLPDGTVLTAGGTHYYSEPGVTDPTSGKSYGVAELQGLKATRIFDPATDTWQNAKGDMHYGRWYPTLITLAGKPGEAGDVFVAGGVTKLLKPLYTDGRAPQDSGRNVVQTETYDPATQLWTVNHSSQAGTDPTLADGSQQSLPLFPRLHLLPDGHVYYDAAGQTFNPDGQAYDEATWAFAKVYDPVTQTWRNLQANTPTGLPLVDGVPVGFRGSGFDVLLPLVPDANGNYPQARVFNGGGVIGQTPGTYLGDNSTTINTIDTAHADALTSTAGPNLLSQRWYGSAVLLPDGTVFVTSGANRDEVVGPGSGSPVLQTELVDPDHGTVTAGPSLAAEHGRTYHNTAVLLPDGRVLIGGHAPIATGYAVQTDAGSAAGLSKPEADSTFQIYSPPYLHYGVPRPTIDSADNLVRWGGSLDIETADAAGIRKVVLVRNPSMTHLTDADQRSVELQFRLQNNGQGNSLVAKVPGSAVLPAGPYMLFIERQARVNGQPKLVPSVSRQVLVLPSTH
ncbi:MAG TPA: galactose oxidase early set domain-containing protein [Mycobacteriales bacterium]|nr:galactose oxidase early set domain-containing protein [Mycobacteriales bacterium]